jgi:hypothetical protein
MAACLSLPPLRAPRRLAPGVASLCGFAGKRDRSDGAACKGKYVSRSAIIAV